MAEFKQKPDGSLAFYRETDGLEISRQGGYAPVGNNTTASIPAFMGDTVMVFNMASSTSSVDGAAKLLLWQNLTGFDLLVGQGIVDVTTGSSSACTASFGSSSNSTGSSSNLIGTQSVGTIGTFTGTTTPVKLTAGNFLTGSCVGTSSGTVMRVFFNYISLPAAGSA